MIDAEMMDEIKTHIKQQNVISLKILMDSFAYSYYHNLIMRYRTNTSLSSEEIDELEVVLQSLDTLYINGWESPLSDAEYDKLHAIYNDLTGKSITNKGEKGKRKVKHDYPELKGTIQKVHYITESDKGSNAIKTHASLERWLESAFEKLGGGHRKWTVGFYLKFDGVSVVFSIKDGVIDKAITRGDADTGEGTDVSANFKGIRLAGLPLGVNVPDKFGVKTEAIMTLDNFKKYSKKYANPNRKLEDPRSAVSGIINSETPSKQMLEFVELVPLAYYMNGKYVFPDDYRGEYSCVKLELGEDRERDFQAIRKTIAHMKKIIDNYDMNCDGVVVRFLDHEAIETLGRDESKSVNRFERAYKFPPEEKETTLLDVEFQVGLLGTISPVAKVEKVKMKGKKISSVSLGSIDRFKTLNLRKGDKVVVKYEIIPYLDKYQDTEGNKNPIITPPEVCPYCHEELEEAPTLMCVNKECPSRVMGKIENYCTKLNIAGIGESTIETFFNAGILKSIADLYKLSDHKSEIIELEGFGTKKYDAIVKEIDKHRKVDGADLLGSIGIKSIGRRKFKDILDIYYFDVLMGMTEKDIPKLLKVPGVKEATAQKVLEGIEDNRELIMFLTKELTVVKKKHGEYNIVFTGVRNPKFAEHLESLGFEINGSVTKKTKYVIKADADYVSGSTKKGEDMGIPVITIIEAYEVFNFH